MGSNMGWFFNGIGTQLVGLVIGLAIGGGVGTWINFPPKQDNGNTLQQKYDTLQSNYHELKSNYNELQSNCSKLPNNYSELQSTCNTLQRHYNELQNNYSTLQTTYNTLQNDMNNIQNHWKILITSLKVGNHAPNGTWIVNPGFRLQSSQMRYLTPQITVDSYINGEVTFYVKIIKPDGTLSTGSSSPRGFSYLNTEHIDRSNNQTLTLSSWGNDDRSTYKSGIYTIQIWYENRCLISEKITIY